ncbi:hypothetical protein CV102_06110 [Natronococcus pandeyae]|uniref:Uncharacterized protein n=1 Tax=Natronococcus pandeyae TaxID=2055836 RepID=A0A8J8Q477_9EURY|nr:hypothetical protein [Natronococcus pandeyae]TYL39995.1 hypothetical protein CV102_06110 [Natronococcus pandeyae]
MTIPGYDSGDIAEFALERAGAHVDIVAGVVPDEFSLERSVQEPPADALAEPIDLVGHDGLRAVEAFRISLVYDPSALPPGASPTDVAVAVDDDDGWETLESTVDLEETTVAATTNDRPPGSTVAAVYDGES